MTRLAIFDLDGTLADGSHRLHHIQRPDGKKDWDAYFNDCDKDTPVYPVLHMLLLLHANKWHVEVWTARSASVRLKTSEWLAEHVFIGIPFKMRPIGDFTQDDVLKRQWLHEHVKQGGVMPTMAFEDRDRVVAMWRSEGVKCFQVAEGNF